MRQSETDAARPALLARSAAWGLLPAMLVVALMLPASWQQLQRNEADMAAATRIQSVEAAVRLQQEVDHHLKLLHLLAGSLRQGGQFGREAERIVSAWPAFQAIHWISPDGEILESAVEEGAESAPDARIPQTADTVPAFLRAVGNDGVAATPPLPLGQDARGVTVYLAVRDDGEVRGVIGGVFRIDRLFGTLLAGGLPERYALQVSDGDRLVYRAGKSVESFENAPRVDVIFDQGSWQLMLAPHGGQVADFGAQFRAELLAIIGVALLGGLLTGLFAYKRMSLRLTEKRFRDLNQLLPDMVLECDRNWQVTYMNRLAQRQLGYTDADLAAGLALDRLLQMEVVSQELSLLQNELLAEQSVNRICNVLCRDGDTNSCEITLGAIRDEAGRFHGARAVLRDITERLEAERAMNRLANFDSTTQLPNRAMFLEVLDHELRQARSSERRLVLMVIDLDNFKNVNDRLGPSMGDMLLREAGQRLREVLDNREYVFRVSGDEFAVLFNALETTDQVEHTARLLLETLRQPYRLRAGTDEFVAATIGISVYPDDATSSEQMYMHADAAVYEAKAKGGRRFRMFTHDISRQLNERRHLEESLRHALRREEFRLFYQPIVNARSGTVIGLEALVRWQHPERGLLAPFHFIRLAEETGQIDEIGGWVLQEACRQMRAWDHVGIHVPQVAVNVSAHQLESGVLGTDVRRALRDHRLDGERLVLELTESLLMRDVHFASRTLAGLKRHGVRTAVDDFGTGYSSLAYLNRLPLDTLKIDRAFIAPIAEEGGDTRVTEAVIALGRSLKLNIVAEGVERVGQAEFLVEHGCHVMQGYLFSKPVAAEEVARILGRDWRRQEAPRQAEVG